MGGSRPPWLRVLRSLPRAGLTGWGGKTEIQPWYAESLVHGLQAAGNRLRSMGVSRLIGEGLEHGPDKPLDFVAVATVAGPYQFPVQRRQLPQAPAHAPEHVLWESGSIHDVPNRQQVRFHALALGPGRSTGGILPGVHRCEKANRTRRALPGDPASDVGAEQRGVMLCKLLAPGVGPFLFFAHEKVRLARLPATEPSGP